jgi:putative endonuclease
MKDRLYSAYIMTNYNNEVFYIGVCSGLMLRIWKHKNKTYPNSFTARYNINKLVWYENFDNPRDAISCEKRLKSWRRDWKIDLVKKENSEFIDLSCDWYGVGAFERAGDSESSSE